MTERTGRAAAPGGGAVPPAADDGHPSRVRRHTGALQEVPRPLRVASEVCARLLVIAAGLALLVFLVVQLRVVVVPVAIAVLLAALLAPLVRWLHVRRVPRALATALVMVGGLAALGGLLTAVVGTLVDGTAGVVQEVTGNIGSLQRLADATPFDLDVGVLGDQLMVLVRDNQQTLTSGAVSTAATLGEILAGFALCLFTLIFMLHDGSRIWSFVRLLAPRARRARIDVAARRSFASLVGYVRATVLVAVVDAAGIGLGLWLTGVPFVLPLAALVFLGAFVPIIGAVLTGAVAVLVALVTGGPVPALVILGVVLAVQQLESHVLQPLLLGRAVRLHPLAVALAVATGVVIAGIAGALLAVPLLAVLTAAVRSLAASREAAPRTVDPLLAREGEPPPATAG
ncbi:AI-2E family transporter [Pseudonocardia spirodelae]|uniref:AI-2E family transporter n=1 Tax=Pseudonocardia spirodelae TaxID=3133431 RepID=A0ABU8TD45_9PSEU